MEQSIGSQRALRTAQPQHQGQRVWLHSTTQVKSVKFPHNRSQRPRGGVEVLFYFTFISALDGGGGQRHGSAISPLERPSTHHIGGWVGSRAGLDGRGKSRPHRDSFAGPSSPQRVAIPIVLLRATRYSVLNIIWNVGTVGFHIPLGSILASYS